jgi:DNA (cytosine-5)-methyltransferase 3A
MLKINSSLVAPAHRRRLYWTNIPNISIPEPIEIKFSDIIKNGYVEKKRLM